MESIYRAYLTRGTSFEMTLSLIQDLLNSRLQSEFRRIWVQGSTTRIVFTIFSDRGYTMRFINTGGLRQFRHDAVLQDEIEVMERFINSVISGCLYDL